MGLPVRGAFSDADRGLGSVATDIDFPDSCCLSSEGYSLSEFLRRAFMAYPTSIC